MKRAKSGRAVFGEWSVNDIRRAFVEGAAWWEFQIRGATMWPSDRGQVADEAESRFQRGDWSEPMTMNTPSTLNDPLTDDQVDAMIGTLAGEPEYAAVYAALVQMQTRLRMYQSDDETREQYAQQTADRLLQQWHEYRWPDGARAAIVEAIMDAPRRALGAITGDDKDLR